VCEKPKRLFVPMMILGSVTPATETLGKGGMETFFVGCSPLTSLVVAATESAIAPATLLMN
jgi:hypothetical protein